MHACPWWIRDNDIRPAMLSKKMIITNFNYIAGKKLSMGNIVERRIFFGIFNGLGYHFHTNDLLCQFAYKYANAAGAAIEVVHNFITSKPCKIPCDGVQLFSLFGIGLKK